MATSAQSKNHSYSFWLEALRSKSWKNRVRRRKNEQKLTASSTLNCGECEELTCQSS
jgi:hypothetical protein